MQTESPALNPEILRGYNLQVQEITLTQVVRQSGDSGILLNATRLRDALRNNTVEIYPKLQLKGFADFRKVNGDELIEEISSAYSHDGIEETMIITRSNKRATIYNNGIRNRILYREEELSTGDRLMVAKTIITESATARKWTSSPTGKSLQILRVRRTTELLRLPLCRCNRPLSGLRPGTGYKDTARHPTDRHPCPAERAKRQAVLHHPEDYDDIPPRPEK